jgi:hypothetical protein
MSYMGFVDCQRSMLRRLGGILGHGLEYRTALVLEKPLMVVSGT